MSQASVRLFEGFVALCLVTQPAEPALHHEGGDRPREARAEQVDRYGDPLPPGAIARLGTVRFREPGCCRLVAYSPDGKLLASAGSRGVAIWDAATGKRVALFRGQQTSGRFNDDSAVESLAFSPDGRCVAGGCGSGIHVWEVATGKLFIPFAEPERGSYPDFVAFTADSRAVLAGDSDRVQLVEITTGKEQWRWVVDEREGRDREKRPPDQVLEFWEKALSPDGKTLAAFVSSRKTKPSLRLWDVETGKERRRIEFASHGELAFAPDGVTLAILGKDQVALWDTVAGKQLRAWKAHRPTDYQCLYPLSPILALAFSPDGKTLATSGCLWEVATGNALRRISESPDRLCSISFSPNGKTLAVGRDLRLELWDVATGKELHVFDAHRGSVFPIASSPDGRTLASAADGTIRLWDPRTGQPIRCFRDLADSCLLAFSPDGTLLAGVGQQDIILWDPATGKVVRELVREREVRGAVASIAFAPDGKTLVSANINRPLQLWDVQEGKELRRFGGDHERALSTAVFSPDSKTIASSGDLGVQLWEAATGNALRRLEELQPKASTTDYCLAFSPDGRLLASVNSHDRALRVWDMASGKRLLDMPGDSLRSEDWWGRVSFLAFSPDGRNLITASRDDGTARVWELLSGKERLRIDADVWRACLAPDGRALAVAEGSSTAVLIWDLTGTKNKPLPARAPDWEALWTDLASADAVKAYQAVWALATGPGEALPLLKKRLQAIPPLGPAQLRRLIAGLDEDRFEARERTSRELQQLGGVAQPALLEARENPASLEQRRRVEQLLELLQKPPPPERLRALRGIETLEYMATAEARAVLESLAKGAPGAVETEHAKAAMNRLHKLRRD